MSDEVAVTVIATGFPSVEKISPLQPQQAQQPTISNPYRQPIKEDAWAKNAEPYTYGTGMGYSVPRTEPTQPIETVQPKQPTAQPVQPTKTEQKPVYSSDDDFSEPIEDTSSEQKGKGDYPAFLKHLFGRK
jgi:hypothetical protein